MSIYDNLYRKLAKLESVYDGDSYRISIDNGKYNWDFNHPVRLFGIDTPELRPRHGSAEEKTAERAAGHEARARALDLLNAATGPLVIQTLKRPGKKLLDKYGRILAHIFIPVGDQVIDLAQQLIEEGHGLPYDGGTKQKIWKVLRPLNQSDCPPAEVAEVA